MRAAGAITGLLVLGSFTIPGTYGAKREAEAIGERPSDRLATSDSTRETAPAAIAGRVYDPEGKPLANASVWLAGSGFWPARRLRTSANGRFAWSDVPPGVYELGAEKDGWVSTPLRGLLVEQGEERVFALRLGVGWVVSGRVVDARTGTGIAGASLTLVEEGVALYSERVQSDADGRFRFGSTSARTPNLYVEAPGYVPSGPLVFSSEELPLEVRLQRGATIEGSVVDSTGGPVDGAVVQAVGNGLIAQRRLGPKNTLGVTSGPVPPITATGGVGRAGLSHTETDIGGRFAIDGLVAGTYALVVSHPNFAPGESGSFRLHAGDLVRGLRIVLHPGAELRGRVVDARGSGLSAVPVELRATEERLPRVTSTDREGGFAFAGVSGEATVTAFPFQLSPARVTVSVDPTARSSPSVELVVPSELHQLDGRVVDTAGFGVEDALIGLRSLDPKRPFRRSTRSEPDGVFAFTTLPEPPYQVTVERPGYSPVRIDRIEDTTPLEVVLAEGVTLLGRVIGDWHGEGVADVDVELQGPVTRRSKTDEDGGFELVDIPLGAYRVAFSHPDYEVHVRTLSLEASRARAPRELDVVRLRPAGSIVGEVRDALGDPVPDAEVTWGDPPLWRHATRTDATGSFRLQGVHPGIQYVSARHTAAGDAVDPRAINVRANETSLGAYVRLPDRLGRATTPAESATRSGLAVTLETVDGEVRVTAVHRDSNSSGRLRPADVLVAIDGQPVTSEKAARELLRGAAGVEVVVTVQREDAERLTFVIERERFEFR